MSSQVSNLKFDVRHLAKEYYTLNIKLENFFWFKVGLFFIKIGCLISGVGIKFEDENV